MHIHLLGMTEHAFKIPDLDCMCASLRRASRGLTQFYEEALRPLGLRSSQFTILQALSIAREVSQGVLGEILSMDSTTLTRTLKTMSREGWIAERRGKDRRERLLSLSDAGRDRFNLAVPAWETAQAQLKREMGCQRWGDLLRLTNELKTLPIQRGELS
jgi:DNA-binding MarR family transcriptional regulator